MDINTIKLFGITFNINPVAFTVPGINWDVYWYGILIAFGFLCAVISAYINAKKVNLNFDKIITAIYVVLPVSVLSARLYYMIFAGESITNMFNFSDGHGFSGLAIYGGVIGAVISAIIMCLILKLDLLNAADITFIGFLVGQGIGRWGNFVNQEAYGSATNSDWFGMTGGKIILETGSNALVHPCFLYESIWCLLGFILLSIYINKRRFKGEIALLYCVWYGSERAIVEGLRTDSLPLGNLRVSQVLSIILVAVALGILTFKYIKIYKEKKNQTLPSNSVLSEISNSTEFKESESNDN